MKIKRGSTSVRRLIFIADSSSTTGAGLANLAHNSAGLVAYYFAGDLSNEVQITLATATLGTYTSGGFVAVDNTNMPGWYEIGIPDAALDGGNECVIQLRGATNMVPVNLYIELDTVDYQVARFGASDGTGVTLAADQAVNVTKVNGTSQTAGDLAALLATLSSYVDTEVAAIKAKTDNLPSDPADQSAVEAAITAATTGLATSANQTTILDRQAYTLAVLAGACSDPQTASETYVLTIGGSTYTVDMAGQTSTGTRTAPTLTKT